MSPGSFFLPRRAGGRSPSGMLVAGLLLACLVWSPPPLDASPFYDGFSYDAQGNVTRHVRATFSSTTVGSGGPSPSSELTLLLENLGPATRSKADVLTGFYFKLVDPSGNVAPKDIPLQWVSAGGKAWQVLGQTDGGDDVGALWHTSPNAWKPTDAADPTPSNLVATKLGEQGWQLRTDIVPTPADDVTFGIGTVGNSDLSSALSFNGRIVNGTPYPGSSAGMPGRQQGNDSMINLGIYSTGGLADIDPDESLTRAVLVRNAATFRFRTSVMLGDDPSRFLRGDIVFGFGTAPDGVIHLPEPGTLPMAATFAVGAAVIPLLRRRRRRG